MNKPQPESAADFKARIAIMKRRQDGAGAYSIVGGPRANKSVVVKPAQPKEAA